MTQPASTRFSFETEFTPQGEILRGPDRKYFSRDLRHMASWELAPTAD